MAQKNVNELVVLCGGRVEFKISDPNEENSTNRSESLYYPTEKFQ